MREIVKPMISAGGDMEDVMILLESVVTGVFLVAVKLGGDNDIIDFFVENVRKRMAEIRLEDILTEGSA